MLDLQSQVPSLPTWDPDATDLWWGQEVCSNIINTSDDSNAHAGLGYTNHMIGLLWLAQMIKNAGDLCQEDPLEKGIAKSVSHSMLWNPLDYSPPGSSVHEIFPAKNTGVGCHFRPQGIFPTQELNPCLLCLLHCRQILYHWVIQEARATHSSILAWRLPWTEGPGRLQSMRSQRVTYVWATNTHARCIVRVLFLYASHLRPVFQNSRKYFPLHLCELWRFKRRRERQARNPACLVDLSVAPLSQPVLPCH